MTSRKTTYDIPAFPVTIMNLLEELSDGNSSLSEIAEVVQEDVAISCKLLSVANTPAYRSRREIDTIGHAVSWLGKEATAAIALSVSMSTLIESQKESRESFRNLWLHSFVQGIAMEEIAYLTKKWNTNKAYISGLMMDIGQLVQLTANPELYQSLHEQEDITVQERLVQEAKLFGDDYTQIGIQIIGSMGLPEDFSIVAGSHLATVEQISQITDIDRQMLVAAAAVTSEIGTYFCKNYKVDSLLKIHRLCSQFLGIDGSLMDSTIESIEARAREKASSYEIDVTHLPSTKTLTGLAVEQLSKKLLHNAMPVDPSAESERLQRECEELREQLREAEDRACRDPLTKCFNREYLQGRLSERVRQCQVTGSRFGVLLIDVDEFKAVNDTHGHLAGDDVLIDLGIAMQDYQGSNGAACRYGGDEFVLMLDSGSRSELQQAANRITATFLERRSTQVPAEVSLSIGGVVAQPFLGDDQTCQKILGAADDAMYVAKAKGGSESEIMDWPLPEHLPGVLRRETNTSVPSPIEM